MRKNLPKDGSFLFRIAVLKLLLNESAPMLIRTESKQDLTQSLLTYDCEVTKDKTRERKDKHLPEFNNVSCDVG